MSQPAAKHGVNNFGFLRLLFATLVILSHSPEMVDGNRTREILSRCFGVMSFGEVGVDGFFLVSGYLIALSLMRSDSAREFIVKRVLRIYPGYIVAYFVSLLIVAPFAGASLADLGAALHPKQFEHLILLDKPEIVSAFQRLPKPYLSGTMWSLAYEFRCYCALLLLANLGLLRNRKTVLAITAILLQLLIVAHANLALLHIPNILMAPVAIHLIGDPMLNIRCYTFFFCGVCFLLFSDKISFRWSHAVVATVLLLNLLSGYQFAEAAYAVLGGYVLFWFALFVKSDFLGKIGSRIDLSYGIYLYAWPIQNLIILHDRNISPWTLFVIAMALSAVCAYLSWTLIERPFLKLKDRPVFVGSKSALKTAYFARS